MWVEYVIDGLMQISKLPKMPKLSEVPKINDWILILNEKV